MCEKCARNDDNGRLTMSPSGKHYHHHFHCFSLWMITTLETLTPFSVPLLLTHIFLPLLALDTLALVSPPAPMGLISLTQILLVLTLTFMCAPLALILTPCDQDSSHDGTHHNHQGRHH